MNMERIVRFGPGGGGGRSLQLEVRGIKILICPRDVEEQAAAEELAEQIAAMGPSEGVAAPVVAVPPPVARPRLAAPRSFTVGERVYCNVHGAEGWCTVTEVGTARNHGRIKISGERAWCPAGNFGREPRR